MKLNLQDFAANGWIRPHTTSQNEIAGLLRLVVRDLNDARIEATSDDRRFATAYNAALQLSKVILAASGYLPAKGQSAHFHAFEVVKSAVTTREVELLCDYFDTCRRKRNHVDCDGSDVVTRSETLEIIEKTSQYFELVIIWLRENHHDLFSNPN